MSTANQLNPEQDATLRAGIDRSLRHPVMFFFTSGAAWLALSLVLGLLASIKSHNPDFLGCIPGFNYGRIFAAHMDSLIYGWAAQAAFGVLIWLMSRLARQECKAAGLILAAGHVWNAAVGFGIGWILIFGASGHQWMQMPKNIYPVLLLCYAVIGIWSFIQFRTRRGGHVYISQWYLLAALFLFPWTLATAHVFINFLDGTALAAYGVNAWFRSAILFLFFTPVAIASAYYLTPKVTGRPVYSYNLGLLGFWVLIVVGPWAGLEKMFGAPYASFLQYAGAAATVLFLAPAIAVGVNILKTVQGRGALVQASPSLLFTVAGICGLLLTAVIGLVKSLPESMQFTNFSLAGYGYEMMALYGFFSMCMFGAIYFIVPRITGREWISTKAIKMHFIFSLYGVLFVALIVGLLGGFMQGLTLDSATASDSDVAKYALPYNWSITVGWAFVALANIAFCIHLLFMWLRLGRRSSHPTLLNAHEPHSPHGVEGNTESLQA